MEPVVKVGVGNSLASGSPRSDGVPPFVLDHVITSATTNLSRETAGIHTTSSPGPNGRVNGGELSVDEVHIVLVGDGAAPVLPGAVSDNASVNLRERQHASSDAPAVD